MNDLPELICILSARLPGKKDIVTGAELCVRAETGPAALTAAKAEEPVNFSTTFLSAALNINGSSPEDISGSE